MYLLIACFMKQKYKIYVYYASINKQMKQWSRSGACLISHSWEDSQRHVIASAFLIFFTIKYYLRTEIFFGWNIFGVKKLFVWDASAICVSFFIAKSLSFYEVTLSSGLCNFLNRGGFLVAIKTVLWPSLINLKSSPYLLVSGGDFFFHGSRAPCNNEGEEVALNTNLEAKCFRCICQVGLFT